jgi:hypothetical protein
VQVVEDQRQRLAAGDPLEQGAGGAVGPVALVDRGRLVGHRQRGQHAAELGAQPRRHQLLGILGDDVGVERIGPQRERHVALELRGGAAQDQHPPLVRAPPQLRQQVGLADPRLTLHREAGRPAVPQLAEHQVQLL